MIELSIVIPCYNEDENIFPLFNKINDLLSKNKNIEVIIIDNGSTDKTNENIITSNLYNNNKIKFKKIEKNIGYGFGIMSGISLAEGICIGWCHADLQTEPSDVYNSWKENKDYLINSKCVVKGRRKNRNFFDALFTFGMSTIVSIIFFSRINDVNAQPKLFHRSFLKYMKNYPYDFSLDLFFLVMAKVNSYKIINHNVYFKKRVYGEAKGGGSFKVKLRLIKRTFSYIVELRKKLWK